MLVGRDAERAQLRALLDDARRGRSGALVLRGEAGAGKTALLDDLIAGAEDLLVLRASGVESESELPYAGLHQLLRPVTHEVDGLAPPRADALRAAFGLRTSGGDERFLVSLAVLDLLAEQSERRPVLCVLDDVHRLDRSSVDALAFVARRLEAERIAMVLAVRDPAAHDVPVDDLPTLHLRELGPDPARRLLERRAGGPVHPDVVVRLVTATGGNALALTELARTLTARQLGGAEPLPAPLPLTAGVGQAFERPRQAELLRCTAERTRTRQVRRFDPDRRPEPWNTRPAIGGPVRVAVGTVVPADLDRVTAEVLTPRLLRYVSWPLIVFTPVDPPALPARWQPGEYRVRMRALGRVPLGEQTIRISFPPTAGGEYLLRDDGSGRLVRRWDHLIRLRAAPDGRSTLYRDEVDIEAGPLTVPVWAFATVLYRWRQRRWRRLARRRFRY